MNIELINTGSELLFGRVLNTHQQWLCRQLTDLGYQVTRQVCVADDGASIQNAAREALGRAEFVIVTGGLGPTSDDITRNLIAQLLGRKLVLDVEILRGLEAFFAKRKRTMLESMKVQALVPEGAHVLPNPNGSAPGLAMQSGERWLVLLPGPPRELRPMFTASVVPILREAFPLQSKFICRTFKTTGLGESMVEERIAGPLRQLVEAGLEIGYCARVGEVDVRLVAKGENAGKLADEGEKIVRSLFPAQIFGLNDDTLELAIVRLLTERHQTVALAESCTGGFIANRLTNVPGSSKVFAGGCVTYSNAAKMSLLGVREETLATHGAVSAEVVCEMAAGARRVFDTNFALAVTGIAGPDGGTDDKPVGTVFIALASPTETTARRHFFPFDRETFKFITSQTALDVLRLTVTCL